MKKITLALLLIQGSFLMAQTKTAVTPYGEKVTIHPFANNGITAGNGFTELGGTLTQQTTITTTDQNTLAIDGLVQSTDSDDKPLVIAPDGTLKKGSFPVVNIIPSSVGTVIAIDGNLEVAQEITALMSADFNFAATTGSKISPASIGNLTKIIVDNKNTFISSATTNNFNVAKSGTYQITMNLLIHNSAKAVFPVIGLYDDTANTWIARINNEYQATKNGPVVAKRLQTYTLITAVQLDAGKKYSFRVGTTSSAGTVLANSTDATGTGPASFVSVKRLN